MNNYKGENMINLKKVGLTALAGSLVAVSATAGEISVTGSANITYVTGKDAAAGKSLGTDKDVAFTGSGELDNGWTFTVSSLLTDAMAISSSYTSLTMGSLGTVSFGQDTGGASYKYDEEVPQAYEQISDAIQTTANVVGNQNDSNMIVYNSPSFDLGGVSASFDLEYSPGAGSSQVNDGGSASQDDDFGSATGAGVTLSYDALKVGVYAAEIERTTPTPTGTDAVRDAFEGVWYAKYSMGPVSIGYSQSYMDGGAAAAIESTTTAKSAGRAQAGIFTGEQMSIAFNVNENLSISYTTADETYDTQDHALTAVATDDDVTQKTDAIQIAYSMGAMSIKAYRMDSENPGWDDDAADMTETEIALGLSF